MSRAGPECTFFFLSAYVCVVLFMRSSYLKDENAVSFPFPQYKGNCGSRCVCLGKFRAFNRNNAPCFNQFFKISIKID